ncbi:uncharacterized protein [Macrobrachium rosenbergii]|uniref:uncharacterized protein n=1 Tax=Macrobrachium rosenbergii TaxID=79674 RepID=UPI0034D563AE
MKFPSTKAPLLLFLSHWLMLGAKDAAAVYRFREVGFSVCGPVSHSRPVANDLLCAIFCSKDVACCAFSTSNNPKPSCLLHSELQYQPKEGYTCYIRDSTSSYTSGSPDTSSTVTEASVIPIVTSEATALVTSVSASVTISGTTANQEVSVTTSTVVSGSATGDGTSAATSESVTPSVTATDPVSPTAGVEETSATNIVTETPATDVGTPSSTTIMTNNTSSSLFTDTISVNRSVNGWFQCPRTFVLYGFIYNPSPNAITGIVCGQTIETLDPIDWATEMYTNTCPSNKLPTEMFMDRYNFYLRCTEMASHLIFSGTTCATLTAQGSTGDLPAICGNSDVLKKIAASSSANQSTNPYMYYQQTASSYDRINFTCCSLKALSPLPSLSLATRRNSVINCNYQGSAALVALGLDFSSQDVEYAACSTFGSSLVTDWEATKEIAIGNEDIPSDNCPSGQVAAALRAVTTNEKNMTALCVSVAGTWTVDTGRCKLVQKNEGPKPTIPGENTSGWSNWISCLHLVGNYTVQQIIRVSTRNPYNYYSFIREFTSILCCPLKTK